MFKKIFINFFFLIIISAQISGQAAFAEEKETQFKIWNSTEGLKMLEESQFKSDFYQLVNFYQPQINPLYCSAASGVMILNALNYGNIPSQKDSEITKPDTAGGGVIEYHLYSQLGFFNSKTDLIKNRDIINFKAPASKSYLENFQKLWKKNEATNKDESVNKENYSPGLSLKDLAKILSRSYQLRVDLTYVKKNDQESLEEFRKKLKKVLSDDKNFMIVNFDGKVLGQKTRGHFSPLAAFDEKSDSVLVFDVALHKTPWYFVSVPKLFEAMNTKDEDDYRGYLIVRK